MKQGQLTQHILGLTTIATLATLPLQAAVARRLK